MFFGEAESIRSDQGRNFDSCVFSALFRRLDMQITHTTPLHPQSDGLVERFHHYIEQQLAIVSAKHQRNMVHTAYRSGVYRNRQILPLFIPAQSMPGD